MNKMKKICIPTNDRKTIAHRTGRAKEFVFYEIKNKKILNTFFVQNPHREHRHEHEHDESEHHHNEIIEILKDVDLFVVKAVGKFLKKDLDEAKVNYVRTDKENLEEILESFI